MSARPTQEISEEERRYEDGTDPKVPDIVAIEIIQPVPQSHQQENHLIDDGYYWVKQGTVLWGDLQRAEEDPAGPLWINGYSSSHGEPGRWFKCNFELRLPGRTRLSIIEGDALK